MLSNFFQSIPSAWRRNRNANSFNMSNGSSCHQSAPRQANLEAAGHPERPSNPQSDALLFGLPEEIRDQIYSYAFTHEAREFTCGDFYVQADEDLQYEACFNDDSSTLRGLPGWLLGCKQLCTEALAVFGRTRHFAHTEWTRTTSQGGPDTHAPRITNSLIFHSGSMTNIVIRSALYPTLRYRNRTLLLITTRAPNPMVDWLDMVKICRGREICLDLVWDWRWHGDSGNGTPQGLEDKTKVFRAPDDSWNGAFRKVRVILIYHPRTGHGVSKLMKEAETCASRLVDGEVARSTMSWKEELELPSEGSHAKWHRCLVVQRKV
jgi:hypothetical protein